MLIFLTAVISIFITEGSNLCLEQLNPACSYSNKSLVCFDGCDCSSKSSLKCDNGFPVCIRTVLLDSHNTGPMARVILNDSLRFNCHQNATELILRNYKYLHTIEPGFFNPIASELTEIHIQNNSILSNISRELFVGEFNNLQVLSIEANPLLSDLSFLMNTDIHNITELLLSNNDIRFTPCDFFDSLPKLQRVDLRGNKIVVMDECTIGMVPYRNPNMGLFLQGNPVICNCSLIPLLDGKVAKLDTKSRHVICTNSPFNTSEIFSLEGTMLLLREFKLCSNQSYLAARNQSRCPCRYSTAKTKCNIDCVLWKKRPRCETGPEGFEKVEGCVCDTFIKYLDSSFDANWYDKLCMERGALTRHLSTMSWKIWLIITAFVLVVFLLPQVKESVAIYVRQREFREKMMEQSFQHDPELFMFLLWGETITPSQETQDEGNDS